jgi:excisionase family DNA binding protein
MPRLRLPRDADVTPPVPVPSLDRIAADPAEAARLPVEATRALLARCALAQGVLLARLLEAAGDGAGAPERAETDHLLTADEAAHRLGVSADWLYRRVTRLPFAVRLGRTVRFSARGLDTYLRQRMGR